MYKITIVKVEKEEQRVREYQKLREPYPNEPEMGPWNSERRVSDPQYGYVETVRSLRTESEVLSQEVGDLDIKKVIKAINEIE